MEGKNIHLFKRIRQSNEDWNKFNVVISCFVRNSEPKENNIIRNIRKRHIIKFFQLCSARR